MPSKLRLDIWKFCLLSSFYPEIEGTRFINALQILFEFNFFDFENFKYKFFHFDLFEIKFFEFEFL